MREVLLILFSFRECQFIRNSIIKGSSLGDGAAVHIYKREIPDIALHVNPLFSKVAYLNTTSLSLNPKKVG